jgi:hypothetical protein
LPKQILSVQRYYSSEAPDPGPSFHYDADPAFHFHVDPELLGLPEFKFEPLQLLDAYPDPQHSSE